MLTPPSYRIINGCASGTIKLSTRPAGEAGSVARKAREIPILRWTWRGLGRGCGLPTPLTIVAVRQVARCEVSQARPGECEPRTAAANGTRRGCGRRWRLSRAKPRGGRRRAGPDRAGPARTRERRWSDAGTSLKHDGTRNVQCFGSPFLACQSEPTTSESLLSGQRDESHRQVVRSGPLPLANRESELAEDAGSQEHAVGAMRNAIHGYSVRLLALRTPFAGDVVEACAEADPDKARVVRGIGHPGADRARAGGLIRRPCRYSGRS